MDKISDLPLVNEFNHGERSPTRRPPLRRIYFGIGLIVLGALGALVVFRWPPAVSAPKKAPVAVRLSPALAVTSATAHRLPWPVTTEASGSIALSDYAFESVSVRATNPGCAA
ncbi:MAG: hypothetical protein JO025_22255 [Verrucomicrobia bacterium]|nr:hypothetical protein [Verrucomicrobiota bacterium]